MKKGIIAVLTGAFLLAATYTAVAQHLSGIKNEIKKNNALYFDLFRAHNLAIVDLYTNDGWLMSPNAPAVKGRAALTQDFTNAYNDANIKGVQFTTQNIYSSGILYVAEEGTWQVFGINGNVVDSGKYLKVWKKTKQGWKIFRDIFNSDRKG